MTFYIILALSAFLISLIGTRLTILTLRRRTLPRIESLREPPVIPTPTGGGIAVFFALIICLAVADIHYGIVLALFLLAAISLLNTLIPVPSLIRLLVQVMAVVAGLSTLDTPTFGGALPVELDRIITGALWLIFTNVYSSMDGIDGMAATGMISIGIGICLITAIQGAFPDALSAYSLITVAAGCGFIWWNWQPAKIYLGKVGSLPVGFLLGYLLLLCVFAGYPYVAIILPGYYLADGLITLGKRLRKKSTIWKGPPEYYYRQAVRNGRRHEMVVRSIFGINILLFFLAARSAVEPAIAAFDISMAYLIVFILLGFFAHTSPHPHHDSPG